MASNTRVIEVLVKMNDQLSKQMNNAASKVQAAGKKISGVGASMTAGLTLPIAGLGVAAFKAFADYQDVMTEIEVRTGATADEMEKMSDMAKQMGADTKFSASEAAQAMLELTSSGSSAAEAMEQLPAVLDLAAAGAIDLGRAADGVTDVLAMFQLEASDSAMVVDALAKATGASSATVASMTDAFANVGPVAAQFGFSVEETAAALAVFHENGIKGAEAGTQLRSMLLNMTRDTADVKAAWKELGTSLYDAQGNMRDIDTVFKEIDAAMQNMSMEDQNRIAKELGGSYGIIGFNALRASGGISDMQEAMSNAASASELADARMNTLSGSFTSLMGSLETLGITLGGLGEGPLTSFIQMMTRAVNAVTSFVENNPRMAQFAMIVLGIIAALGPLLMFIGQLMSMWGTLMAIISAIGPAVTAIGGAFGAMASILPAVGAAIAAIGGPVLLITGLILGLLYIIYRFRDEIANALAPAIRWVVGFFRDLMAKFATFYDNNIRSAESWKEAVVNVFKSLGALVLKLLVPLADTMLQLGKNIIVSLAQGIKENAQQLIQAAKDMAQKAAQTIRDAFQIRSPSRVMMEIGAQVTAGFQQGVQKDEGLAVPVPRPGDFAGAAMSGGAVAVGAGNGAGVYIENLTVPPGTTQEQIEIIMREIGRRARKRGALGRY